MTVALMCFKRAWDASACTASKLLQCSSVCTSLEVPLVEVLCLGWWMAWLAHVHHLTCRTDSHCCACSQHFHERQFRKPHPPVQDVVQLHCKTCTTYRVCSRDYPLCLACARKVLRRGTCPALEPHPLSNRACSKPCSLLFDTADS